MGTFSFEPRLVTTLAAIACFALLVSLGRWQVARAHEKEVKQALYDARGRAAPVVLAGPVATPGEILYRRVRATGRWIAERQVFIDNQIREGRAGFSVVTPLRLAGVPDVVLVNRGWIARGTGYPRPPPVPVPEGEVEVAGVAYLPPARFLELSDKVVAGEVWQNLSIERLRKSSGLPLLPVVIQAGAAAAGLEATFEKPDAGVARHQEYALTWFSLAATTLALWLALNVRRAR